MSPIFGGSAFADVRSVQPVEQFPGDLACSDFVEFLHELHSRQVAKNDAGLWSPATYEGGRSLADIKVIHAVFLDNDSGDLEIDEFVAMFPNFQMAIYNTASSTNERREWRVVIPTTHAMTLDVHEDIVAQIKKSLAARGYFDKNQLEKRAKRGLGGKDHGFDPSKFNPAAMFYLPAQAQAGAEHSFFYEFPECRRQPINPYRWIDRRVINHQPEPEPEPEVTSVGEADGADASTNSRANRIEQTLAECRNAAKGSGNQEFNRLIWRLRAAAMEMGEIRHTLARRSPTANSGSDAELGAKAEKVVREEGRRMRKPIRDSAHPPESARTRITQFFIVTSAQFCYRSRRRVHRPASIN